MNDKANNVFKWIDNKLGVDQKYQKACHEEREILMNCVLQSSCFKQHKHFQFCMQEGIDEDCKALRYALFLCKRSQVYWVRSLREKGR